MNDQPTAVRRNPIAVYSCFTGQHEPLNEASMGAGGAYDRVLFTDDPSVSYAGAQVVPIVGENLCPQKASRLPKICPHRFLPDHDWVIYVDNRAELRTDPVEIVARIEEAHPGLPGGRYLFPHPGRRCAYKETRIAAVKGMIEESVKQRILTAFKNHQMPRKLGMYMNTMMIQKMGNPVADAFNEVWWDTYQELCQRDQISLPLALWRTRYAAPELDFGVGEIGVWPVFTRRDRSKYRWKLQQAA